MKNQIKKKIILKLNPDKQTAIKSKRRQSDIKKEKKKKTKMRRQHIHSNWKQSKIPNDDVRQSRNKTVERVKKKAKKAKKKKNEIKPLARQYLHRLLKHIFAWRFLPFFLCRAFFYLFQFFERSYPTNQCVHTILK